MSRVPDWKPFFITARAPNKRLKLAAPVRKQTGCYLELRYARFSFVIIAARRGSLSAIR